MGIGNALQDLLEIKKTNVNELAKKISVSPQTLYSIIKRDNMKVDFDILLKISDELDIDIDYFYNRSKNSSSVLSIEDSNLLKKYHCLDAHGKEIINYIINLELKRIEQENQKEEKRLCLEKEIQENQKFNTIYYSGIPASAGEGYYSMDIAQAETLELKNPPPRGTSFIIRVTGNSMEPLIKDGDKIFVKSQKDVEVGEIGIFIVNNDFYVKKRGEHELIFLNPNYPPITIEEFDNVYCKGKFLGICDEDID